MCACVCAKKGADANAHWGLVAVLGIPRLGRPRGTAEEDDQPRPGAGGGGIWPGQPNDHIWPHACPQYGEEPPPTYCPAGCEGRGDRMRHGSPWLAELSSQHRQRERASSKPLYKWVATACGSRQQAHCRLQFVDFGVPSRLPPVVCNHHCPPVCVFQASDMKAQSAELAGKPPGQVHVASQVP